VFGPAIVHVGARSPFKSRASEKGYWVIRKGGLVATTRTDCCRQKPIFCKKSQSSFLHITRQSRLLCTIGQRYSTLIWTPPQRARRRRAKGENLRSHATRSDRHRNFPVYQPRAGQTGRPIANGRAPKSRLVQPHRLSCKRGRVTLPRTKNPHSCRQGSA
jgi:hypothetical protein